MIARIICIGYSVFIAVTILALLTCAGCNDQKSSNNSSLKHGGVDSGRVPSGNYSDPDRSAAKPPHTSGAFQKPLADRTQGMAKIETDGEPLLRYVEPVPGLKARSEFLFLNSNHMSDAVVVVTLPLDYQKHPDKKYPLVIAFGGAGECARPPREGALAWAQYYRMDEAIKALTSNHLESVDFRGLVTPEQLTYFNNRLKKEPYSGVIVACPYSPLISNPREFEDPKYEHFIMDELVPLLKRRFRVEEGRVGVDGVSMGGARSMFFGLKYPMTFFSIGSSQGAFGPFMDTYSDLIRTNREILKKRPIQLVTSDGDGMAPSVKKMSALLNSEGIPHTYLNLTGPHDYIFNQGPGSISLLMFHNTAKPRQSTGPVK
ncbi:MAG: alpha/beta hydrolase-fold protein [Pseudomonadota bacterium]